MYNKQNVSRRSLGKTSIKPTVVALGGAGIGSNKNRIFFSGPISDVQAVDTVHTALDEGINLLDTSPLYGDSERKIGLALREWGGNRNDFYISTKAGTHPDRSGFDYDTFMWCIDNSLKQLRTDYIDILNIHDPSKAELSEILRTNSARKALFELKEQGVIRCIGLGVREHELHQAFIESGWADSILPYFDFNLLRQNLLPLLDFCAEKSIGVLLGTPVCMGYLTGRNPQSILVKHIDIHKEIDVSRAQEMYDYCQKKSWDLLALNFHYILQHQAISTIVVGASSPKEVKANIAAIQAAPSHEVMKELIEVFELPEITKDATTYL